LYPILLQGTSADLVISKQ